MSQAQPITDARLTEYLLGLLPEEETEQLDEAAIVDDEMAGRVAALEHELFDAYAAGELDHRQRVRFEETFLKSAEGRRRLDLAHALRTQTGIAASDQTRRIRVPIRWMAAAAVVLLAVATWRILLTRETPRGPAGPDRTDQDTAPGTPTTPPTPTVPDSGVVVTFVLSPLTSRSAADAATLVIAPESRTIALTLVGDPGSAPVNAPQVTIRTVDGREVFRAAGRPPRVTDDNSLAEIDVPASVLPADDYIVQLNDLQQGLERERSRYFLRVRDR